MLTILLFVTFFKIQCDNFQKKNKNKLPMGAFLPQLSNKQIKTPESQLRETHLQ